MSFCEALKTAADKEGLFLNDTQLSQFEKYFQLLVEWNEKINLTAITAPDEVIIKHFIDSLEIFKYFDIKKNAKVIDVGTGAGFPGIPMKIYRPDIELSLLDSLNKRLKFLDIVIKEININSTLYHYRAEDGARDIKLRDRFDYAVSRAVARLSILSEYCLPYVKVGGEFIALKGPDIKEELEQAQTPINKLQGKCGKVCEYKIPNGDSRTAISILKIDATPKIYPRISGKIKTGPIE